MKKKRIIFLTLTVLIFALTIAGCSPNSKQKNNKEKIEMDTDGGALAEQTEGDIENKEDIKDKEDEIDWENFEMDLGEKAKISKEEIESLYSTDKNMLLYFNDFSGKLAPNFEMIDLEENKVNLKDFKGKNVILEFMGTWCPVCKETLTTNNKFNKQYENAKIIQVGVEETTDSMKELAEEVKLENLEYFIPTSKDTYETYDVFFVPIYFYVDKEGYVQMILAGDAPLEMLIEYADKSFS